jgi:uncharacterized coiled-coil protein SlyX
MAVTQRGVIVWQWNESKRLRVLSALLVSLLFLSFCTRLGAEEVVSVPVSTLIELETTLTTAQQELITAQTQLTTARDRLQTAQQQLTQQATVLRSQSESLTKLSQRFDDFANSLQAAVDDLTVSRNVWRVVGVVGVGYVLIRSAVDLFTLWTQ